MRNTWPFFIACRICVCMESKY